MYPRISCQDMLGRWSRLAEPSLIGALRLGVDLPRSEPEAEPLLLKTKFQLEENNASQLRLLSV